MSANKMLSQEEIEEQQKLLEIYRRTVTHLSQQAAQYGGEVYAPPATANGIHEAREEITCIKDILRTNGVAVTDHPNDSPDTKLPINVQDTTSKTSVENTLSHRLRIFLCHSSKDKSTVRILYQRLLREGFKPWFDEDDLVPGQNWRDEIKKAVQNADVVLVCLSRKSVTKAGYVQKEIEYALEIAAAKPKGTMFLIPVRLKACDVPEVLAEWQWVNLYELSGFVDLLRALKARSHAVEQTTVEKQQKVEYTRQATRALTILSEVFPDLSKALLFEIANRSEIMGFLADEIVIQEGDMADYFYIITEGYVVITCQDNTGNETHVALLGPGNIFGEGGLLEERPRSATVRAQTKIEVLALDRETFKIILSSKESANRLTKIAQTRLSILSRS